MENVPVDGIEPPTFGLQNHCTTAVLHRLFTFSEGFDKLKPIISKLSNFYQILKNYLRGSRVEVALSCSLLIPSQDLFHVG